MKMRIKSLHLEDFKGVKSETYNLDSDVVKVSGRNRLGKTTMATGWYWLMVDKNYELASNPNIRPDDGRECIPTVTAVLDIDGKEITISKMQKKKVSKDGKVSLTNTYSINEVPKTERDFKAYLIDLGLDFDKFLPLSHPDVFTSQKSADMRKILFGMASEKTDSDIAAMSDETLGVAKMLESYTMEEISAMQKASKKKATEQCESIPNQIIGLEKAKVQIDVAEQELAKKDLERKIAEIDEKSTNSDGVLDSLMKQSMDLQFELNSIYSAENDKLVKTKRETSEKLDTSVRTLRKAQSDIAITQKDIASLDAKKNIADSSRKSLGEEYKVELAKEFDDSKWKFDEKDTVCSLCGQTLPEDKISRIKADFESRKANAKKKFEEDKKAELKRLIEDGTKYKNEVDSTESQIACLFGKLKDFQKEEKTFMEESEKLKAEYDSLPDKPDMDNNSEYVKKSDDYHKLQEQIEEIRTSGNKADSSTEERDSLVAELDEVKKQIALFERNSEIDEQISDLQKSHRDYEQAKADAERILYQLDLVQKKKTELLTDEINSHFGLVSWKLFDFQKNGEYKEVCIPVIDGKEYGISTNTGRQIQAELDICDSLQKFYGMSLPVWLDKAESLNSEYLPKMCCQLVTLSVSDSEKLKVEV